MTKESTEMVVKPQTNLTMNTENNGFPVHVIPPFEDLKGKAM